MFALQTAPRPELKLLDLSLRVPDTDTIVTRFDLELHWWERQGQLTLSLIYATDLFKPQTIERMLGHLEVLLEAIVADPDQPVARLPILTEAERYQLLEEFNRVAVSYPSDQCVHELFAAQAERRPEALAVVFEDEQMTYGELNRRANQLAHYLRGLGVGAEQVVGLCMRRSI